jgi:hypothetical protein
LTAAGSGTASRSRAAVAAAAVRAARAAVRSSLSCRSTCHGVLLAASSSAAQLSRSRARHPRSSSLFALGWGGLVARWRGRSGHGGFQSSARPFAAMPDTRGTALSRRHAKARASIAAAQVCRARLCGVTGTACN